MDIYKLMKEKFDAFRQKKTKEEISQEAEKQTKG